MRIRRTYPQPDSTAPHLGPRERALAVYKYLLNLEPEQAVEHELFPVIVHAFEVAEWRGFDGCCERLMGDLARKTGESLIPELSSEFEVS